nr:hypothetical protein [Cronobacter dublinensis]
MAGALRLPALRVSFFCRAGKRSAPAAPPHRHSNPPTQIHRQQKRLPKGSLFSRCLSADYAMSSWYCGTGLRKLRVTHAR